MSPARSQYIHSVICATGMSCWLHMFVYSHIIHVCVFVCLFGSICSAICTFVHRCVCAQLGCKSQGCFNRPGHSVAEGSDVQYTVKDASCTVYY